MGKFELNAFTCECPECKCQLIFDNVKIKNRKYVKCMVCGTKIDSNKLEKYKPRRNFYG